jgi:hypothetical protein
MQQLSSSQRGCFFRTLKLLKIEHRVLEGSEKAQAIPSQPQVVDARDREDRVLI